MQDSKEIKQARTIQSSWTNNQPAKKPDFKPVDILGAVPGAKDGIGIDPDNGAYCCLKCRKEIRRLELTLFGKPFRPLPDCGCKAEELRKEQETAERLERRGRLQKYYAKNIIAPAIKDATFENWVTRPDTEKAHAAALDFYNNFESREIGLLLTGDPGNGKSHLARAAQRALDDKGWVTLFLDWPQLTELAKATFDQNNISVADIVRGACDADLLVLDELGAGKLTDWEYKTLLFPLLNGRSGKKTFATTNLNLKELENWFQWGRPEGPDKNGVEIDAKGRLFDRLLGNFQTVKNNGTSKRREDALARKQQ